MWENRTNTPSFKPCSALCKLQRAPSRFPQTKPTQALKRMETHPMQIKATTTGQKNVAVASAEVWDTSGATALKQRLLIHHWQNGARLHQRRENQRKRQWMECSTSTARGVVKEMGCGWEETRPTSQLTTGVLQQQRVPQLKPLQRKEQSKEPLRKECLGQTL